MVTVVSRRCGVISKTVLTQSVITRRDVLNIGCKAARLEPPPHFSNSKAFRLLTPSPLFATCRAYYEAVFCGVPNKK